MRISGAFPSEFLKAADLQGRAVRVKINHVEMRDIGGDHKPVLYFEGKDKGMVLNKTNSSNIAAAYGDETDDWAGGEVELFEAQVDFQGKTVPAIRIRIPPRQPARQAAPAKSAPAGNGPDLNDDIPFIYQWQ